MIKIDLHLHSKASKINGDVISWDSSYEVVKKLHEHNVKIASFSDHNIFDYKLYQEISLLAKQVNILVLPGIELNVVRINGEIANMLYIFSNKLSNEMLLDLEKLTLTITKSGISLKKVNTIFSKFKPLLIPHVGKSHYFSMEDLQGIEFDAVEISSWLHKNYVRFKKANFNKSVVAFSDTHKWNKYPEFSKLKTMLPIQEFSFEAIKKIFKLNQDFTKQYY